MTSPFSCRTNSELSSRGKSIHSGSQTEFRTVCRYPMSSASHPLEIAQQLQRGLLPETIPQAHPFHIGVLSVSAEKVGGDFYDFLPREGNSFDFVLGDATGHGLTAALVVAVAQAAFREGIESGVELPQILDHADHLLHQRLPRRFFIAANYGHVTPEDSRILLFNAAQQSLFLDAKRGDCCEIEVEGSALPLGITGRGGYHPSVLTLDQDDLIVCASDGIPEALNPRGEMFGYERLKEAIQQASGTEPGEVINRVFRSVYEFADGCEQGDDSTVVVIRADSGWSGGLVEVEDRAVVGERRPVALFCLQASEGKAPQALPVSVWEEIQREVDQYGGVVDQLSPDTVVGCFGLPNLHEDDPERSIMAARSAAQILAGRGFDAHCGLHVGTVVTRVDGSIDYSLMGETLVETLRLLDEGKPGCSLLSEDAYQRLAGRMRLHAREEVRFERRIYALAALVQVRQMSRSIQRRDSLFVGRQLELGRLRQAWKRAGRRRGAVTMASVVGEAGIGKTRLVEEFLRRKGRDGVLRGQVRPYPPESAGLFSSLVRCWLGVEDGDAESGLEKLEERLEEFGDKDVRDSKPYLKGLMGQREDLPGGLDPQMYQTELARAVHLFLQALARQMAERDEPLVLVLEDLQWIDPLSAAILTALVGEFKFDREILVLALTRPEEEVLALLSGCRRHAQIVLEPLHEADVDKWIRGTLPGGEVEDEMLNALQLQTEGHPLFLEELLNHLRERELLYEENGEWKIQRSGEWSIPGNLNGLILSRVDQLAHAPRQLLRNASVIGKEFSGGLLKEMAEGIEEDELRGSIEDLVEGQFIVEIEGQRTFTFRHMLIWQTVYETLLADDRKRLHARVGQILEMQYGEQGESQPELLAHHFYRAEVWDKALDYLVRAGEKGIAAYANQDALDYYARALEVCRMLGNSTLETEIDVARRRGLVNFTIDEYEGAIDDFKRMLLGAQALGDRRLEGMALAYRGWMERSNHDNAAAEETLRAALDVAGRESEDVRFFASANLGLLFRVFNRHAEAEPLLRVADELAPGIEEPSMRDGWFFSSLWSSFWKGRFGDVVERLDRWGDVLKETAQPFIQLLCRWVEALATAGRGEYERSLALLEELLSVSERAGDIWTWTRCLNSLGWIYGELQDHRRAMEWNARSARESREARFLNPECENNALLNLGDNLVALGNLDEAEVNYRKVEKVVRNPRPQDHYMLWRYAQHLFHSYGELWLLRGETEKALVYAGECLAGAEESGSMKNVVKGLRLRGQVFLKQGGLTEAEDALSSALESARQVGNPPQLWKTHVALGDLRWAQERCADARREYADALSVIEGVAVGLGDGSLRGALLNSDAAQAIRQKVDRSSENGRRDSDQGGEG